MKVINRQSSAIRKISSFLLLFGLLVTCYLLLVTPIKAACAPSDLNCIIGGVNDPTGVAGTTGDEKISNFLSLIVRLIFIGGALVFVFMVVLSAVQWIASGGDKEAITKARQRLINAIIGLVLLSVSFVIINVIANITHIGLISTPFTQQAPAPGTPTCSGDRTWDPVTKRCI